MSLEVNVNELIAELNKQTSNVKALQCIKLLYN